MMRVCQLEPLEVFASQLFRNMGADEDVSHEVARHLVSANLAGHDSHGVLQIAEYVKETARGALFPGARPIVMKKAGAAALIDARRGFGHFSTAMGLDWAVDAAERYSVGVVAIRHSTHIGRLGHYSEEAAARGMIALITVGAGGPGTGDMLLFGGVKRFFGPNPWSVGVPGSSQSMVFDGSMSVVAEGKVRLARDTNESLPPGRIVDKYGRPSHDPADFYAGGSLVPLGGHEAGHKGYGLAFASALLGGLSMIDDPDPSFIGDSSPDELVPSRGQIGGVFIVAIDPKAFGERAHYQEMVDDALAVAKEVPPQAGVEEILIPGESEARARMRREVEGIPVPEETWESLGGLAEQLNVPLPESRRIPYNEDRLRRSHK